MTAKREEVQFANATIERKILKEKNHSWSGHLNVPDWRKRRPFFFIHTSVYDWFTLKIGQSEKKAEKCVTFYGNRPLWWWYKTFVSSVPCRLVFRCIWHHQKRKRKVCIISRVIKSEVEKQLSQSRITQTHTRIYGEWIGDLKSLE